jgi:cellobiose transport system permease protein
MAVQAATRRRGLGIRSRLHRLDAGVSPYLYVAPFFVLFGVFGLFPLGYTAWISLTDRTLLGSATHFVGLDNYVQLIHDSYFWNAVENTLAIWVIATVPQLVIALGLAHLLNTQLRARTLFRMCVILPQVTSLVAVALIFTQLFSRDYGLVNYVLGGVGIGPVDWEAGRLSSWIALSTMVTWRWAGYNALIYLAAMQGIPDELYEAAAIDGADRGVKRFLLVTWPMLAPVTLFVTVMTIIRAFSVFETVAVLTKGGPMKSTSVILYTFYEEGFRFFRVGYASAIAVSFFVFVTLLSLLQMRISERRQRTSTNGGRS